MAAAAAAAAAQVKPVEVPGSKTHATEPTGECGCCWNDLSVDNYVEYQKSATNELWYPSKFCDACLQVLIDTQFAKYKHAIQHPTCKAEHRRLLARGPPQSVFDAMALPNDDAKNERGNPTGEVFALWYAKDNKVTKGTLKDALTGEERMKWWNEQQALFIDGPDDDEPAKPAAGAAAGAAVAATAVKAK